MLTVVMAIIGFVGGFIPEMMKYFKDKADKKQELAIMDKQIEAQKLGHIQKLEEINVQADISETVALYKSAETKLTGYKWLDGFIEAYNSGVRPTITYVFLIFYGAHKFGYVETEFDEFDKSTLTLVLSYWFGQRAAKYAFGRK